MNKLEKTLSKLLPFSNINVLELFLKISVGYLQTKSEVDNKNQMADRKTGQDALLHWCKINTSSYPRVNIKDFDESWKDGLAFCALLLSQRPNALGIDFTNLTPSKASQNLEMAFRSAEKEGIPRLIEVDDMIEPDRSTIIMYLSQWYHIFSSSKSQAANQRVESLQPASGRGRNAMNFAAAGNNNTRSSVQVGAGDPFSRPKCAKCKAPLSGNIVQGAGSSGTFVFHRECFTCNTCSTSLTGKPCVNIENLPYCQTCAKLAFRST